MTDFVPWAPIPRLFRDVTITEKIDGSNGQVLIERYEGQDYDPDNTCVFYDGIIEWIVKAGSRKRWLSPGKTSDNFGFADWAWGNAEELVRILGPGRHYGEWWGSGIQRGYGLPNGEKWFSLFNADRWHEVEIYGGSDWAPINLSTVPIIGKFAFSTENVDKVIEELKLYGSFLPQAPDYSDPEGIVVRHDKSGHVYKVTLDGDGHKGAKVSNV